MTPRLSRGEYWLLTNAVEYGLPLRMLTLPEWPQDDPRAATIDVVLNKRGHGLDPDELAETLHDMLEHGWITLSRHVLQRASLHPDRVKMRRILDEKGRFHEGVFYHLTPEGRAAWESFARPEWDRYFTHDGESHEDSSISEVIASSERVLNRYMASLERETPVDTESRIYDELRPWQATYRKTLPAGFRCRYRPQRAEPALPSTFPSAYFPSTEWLGSRWCPWL